MSKFVASVSLFLLVGGAAAVWVQHQDNARLQRDVASLRDEVRGAVHAARENTAGAPRSQPAGEEPVADRRRGEGDDLARLREEIVALRKSTQTLTEFAQAAQAAAALKSLAGTESSVPTQLVPSNAWKNAGKATPEAATETVLWAALGGDVDTLSDAVVFTPTAREKADALFASLSESARRQYGTAEKVIALMIAKDAATLSGMQVLGQKEIATDNVAVRLRFANTEGKTKDDNFLMRRGNDGWRLVLPDAAVEKFARQLSGRK